MPPGFFKAYDVRGAYPRELDENAARRIGRAVARHLGCRNALVGHDMRRSSPALAGALIEGLLESGVDVTSIGEASSPLTYFAGRSFECTVVVTASHNPLPDNGMKICGAGALPMGSASGLREVAALYERDEAPAQTRRGTLTETTARAEFVLASRRSLTTEGRTRIVVDGGHGAAGPDYAELARQEPRLDIVPLYLEPDDNFPAHDPNPLVFENLRDLQRAVPEAGAALGVALDGDGDRAFFVDERGGIVPADLTTALLADELLRDHPGGAVIHDLRSSRVVAETVAAAGGRALEGRVGHSFLKHAIAETGAVFAGELAGHYYFASEGGAENTLLALFLLLGRLEREARPLSEVVAPLRRYASSGEINSRVADPEAVLARLAERYADGECSTLDGLKVRYRSWWFNARPSNTEPYLRLVVEADSEEELARHRDALLAEIRR